MSDEKYNIIFFNINTMGCPLPKKINHISQWPTFHRPSCQHDFDWEASIYVKCKSPSAATYTGNTYCKHTSIKAHMVSNDSESLHTVLISATQLPCHKHKQVPHSHTAQWVLLQKPRHVSMKTDNIITKGEGRKYMYMQITRLYSF